MRRRKRRKCSTKIEESTGPFVYDQRKLQEEVLEVTDARRICKVFKDAEAEWGSKTLRKWRNRGSRKQIKTIIEGCKGKAVDELHPLRWCLKFLPMVTLRRVYTEFIDPITRKNLTKDILLWEIVYKFIGESSPLDSRETETKNLESVKNLNEMIRLTKFGDFTIPKEITDQIFDFLEQNYETIVKIGSVCSNFYLAILSSWKSVRIDGVNVYQIPLLVLQSVREVTFLRKHDYSSKTGLLQRDWEYLFPKLERIRVLKFDPYQFKSLLPALWKHKNESKQISSLPLLRNVTEIEYVQHPSVHAYSNWRNCDPRLWDRKYEILFPSLSSICGVKDFSNDKSSSRDDDDNNNMTSKIRKIGFYDCPFSSSPFSFSKKITLNGLESMKYNIRRLTLNFRRREWNRDVSRLFFVLGSLPMIEELEIVFRGWPNDKQFSFADFEKYQNIKKIVVRNIGSFFPHYSWSNRYDGRPDNKILKPVTIDFSRPEVSPFREIQIFSFGPKKKKQQQQEEEEKKKKKENSTKVYSPGYRRNSSTYSLKNDTEDSGIQKSYNFNFEELVSSKFLEMENLNLTIFKAVLPFSSSLRSLTDTIEALRDSCRVEKKKKKRKKRKKRFHSLRSSESRKHRKYCKKAVKTIDEFLNFVISREFTDKYEYFDLKILLGQNKEDEEISFRIKYYREWRRFQVKFVSPEDDEDDDDVSFTNYYDEEICSDVSRMRKVLVADGRPGILLLCAFVNRIIVRRKKEIFFVGEVFEFSSHGSCVSSFLKFLCGVAEKSCVKDFFEFEETYGLFVRK